MATDIAFALGVLALTGSALPGTARVFLLGLAVADDLGAIVIIAVLFSSGLDVLALAGAALGCLAYWWLQRRRTRAWWVYVPLAVLVWGLVHEAGVHPTIAGVLLGLLTRVRPDPGEHEAPCCVSSTGCSPGRPGSACRCSRCSRPGCRLVPRRCGQW